MVVLWKGKATIWTTVKCSFVNVKITWNYFTDFILMSCIYFWIKRWFKCHFFFFLSTINTSGSHIAWFWRICFYINVSLLFDLLITITWFQQVHPILNWTLALLYLWRNWYLNDWFATSFENGMHPTFIHNHCWLFLYSSMDSNL